MSKQSFTEKLYGEIVEFVVTNNEAYRSSDNGMAKLNIRAFHDSILQLIEGLIGEEGTNVWAREAWLQGRDELRAELRAKLRKESK